MVDLMEPLGVESLKVYQCTTEWADRRREDYVKWRGRFDGEVNSGKRSERDLYEYRRRMTIYAANHLAVLDHVALVWMRWLAMVTCPLHKLLPEGQRRAVVGRLHVSIAALDVVVRNALSEGVPKAQVRPAK